MSMLDQKMVALINKYPDLIDSIHFTDQFQGIRQADTEQVSTKMPETKKMLMFSFNIPSKRLLSDVMPELLQLTSLVFYFVDKVKRFRLSREAKTKADKNRQKVEENFLKNTHAVRAEQAALRKEEKRRLEKERVMTEETPEKQRRWEEKEYKREMKKKAPKMKQLKVKAL